MGQENSKYPSSTDCGKEEVDPERLIEDIMIRAEQIRNQLYTQELSIAEIIRFQAIVAEYSQQLHASGIVDVEVKEQISKLSEELNSARGERINECSDIPSLNKIENMFNNVYTDVVKAVKNEDSARVNFGLQSIEDLTRDLQLLNVESKENIELEQKMRMFHKTIEDLKDKTNKVEILDADKEEVTHAHFDKECASTAECEVKDTKREGRISKKLTSPFSLLKRKIKPKKKQKSVIVCTDNLVEEEIPKTELVIDEVDCINTCFEDLEKIAANIGSLSKEDYSSIWEDLEKNREYLKNLEILYQNYASKRLEAAFDEMLQMFPDSGCI